MCNMRKCMPKPRAPIKPIAHRAAPARILQRKFRPARAWYGLQDLSPGGVPTPQSPVPDLEGEDSDRSRQQQQGSQQQSTWKESLYKMIESGATAFASIAVLGAVGYGYHRYYKGLVLDKINHAFDSGDPALVMASAEEEGSDQPDSYKAKGDHWIKRAEQEKIDRIIAGADTGHYYLLVGPKGSGKTSMLLDAMDKIDGFGASIFDAHANQEIFRIRLGKALDYEFHEDYIGSLFSIKGPRDTTALLDIERAFNKLEKVAVHRRKKDGRPLLLIINNVHFIRNDDDGRDLLEMIQQRAELWAASNLITVVFNSDEYWIYERLKRYSNRMEVIPINDLPKKEAMNALENHRKRYSKETCGPSILEQVYDKIGGRAAFLNHVAKAPDMLNACDAIIEREKTWFLSQCGILGSEMDDDVMDQQKFASAAMVLAKALVDKEKEMEKTYDPETGHVLPDFPLHIARYIMTRADFIQQYDADNLFTIDSKALVRADSVPMQHAFREICSVEGFADFLEATLDRISDIESLGRTRELTVKDFWHGGKFKTILRDYKGRETGALEVGVEKPQGEEDDD